MNLLSDWYSRFTSFFGTYHRIGEIEDVLMPLPTALDELRSRNTDHRLRSKVEEYLRNDIPEHFARGPILYLARHIATPNFETLRFLHLVEPLGIHPVIGQDTRDKFVSRNVLKRALGKLPVSLGIHHTKGKYNERYENLTIIDFNSSDGKRFDSILTKWGEPLADFHTDLFKKLVSIDVTIVNDAEWIDRNGRGDLLEHYKRFLALFITHGILFEDYLLDDPEEQWFLDEILYPATRFIEEKFGCRPLITKLATTSVESPDFWMSYPKEVLEIAQRQMGDVSSPSNGTSSATIVRP